MLLLALACKSDPVATATPTDSGPDCAGEVVEGQSAESETFGGAATLRFEVSEGTRAFVATIEVEENVLVTEVINPAGETVYSYEDVYATTPYELPGAIAQPLAGEVQVGWPMLPGDPAPEPGEWSIKVYVLDAGYTALNFAPVWGTLFETRSEETEGRCLSARVILSEGINEDAELMAVIEDVVGRWEALYADMGITLIADIEPSSLASTVTLPADGDTDYAAIDAEAAGEVVTVIIGESFSGSAYGVLGQTGGLPGPILNTDRAAVAISWLMNAGVDAAFTEDETRMFSETIAHEVGHYLGLMHPVQFDESYDVVAFDALSDTDRCTDYYDCDDELGDNLMYPFAGCWWGSGCDPQDELTDDQGTVMRGYGGVY